MLPSADIARAAAQRLTILDPELPIWVEIQLQASPGEEPSQYIEPTLVVALANLLVNVAGLAWKIYCDLKSRMATPAPETIANQVRQDAEWPASVSEPQRDQIISTVVDVIHRADTAP